LQFVKFKQLKETNGYIEVYGARENNLKDISLKIPRNKMVVVTGISGSGKSSLAFDTIYAEGQRRYMETFSSYARQFIGKMERPDVEQILGMSPVISIEQKTTGWNPRSTVGTITELYDFMRLLYARLGEAYSYNTGKKMIRYSEAQIIDHILTQFLTKKISILAPLVRGRKGHYRELFEQMRKRGYTKIRIDEKYHDLVPGLQTDRFKVHNIELVIDRLEVQTTKRSRLASSLQTALNLGNGFIFISDLTDDSIHPYSKQLMCPDTGISYEEPSPNSFSFNSPYGACVTCKGLGFVNEIDMNKVIPDPRKSINTGGIVPFGELRENYTFQQLRSIAKKYDFSLATPIKDIPEEAMNVIMEGGDETFEISLKYSKHDFTYNLAFNGLKKMLEKWFKESGSDRIRSWAEEFMTINTCESCQGYRLKRESLHFKINGEHIGKLATFDLNELKSWIDNAKLQLSDRDQKVGGEIIKELSARLDFLLHVGLDYLHLNRPAKSLSGGEAQRTRLATQIGSQLTGVTYILDEPSIGLHQRDNHRLIESLKNLAAIGNTVLVVEHDRDIMLEADHLIDLGPGAGKMGGELMVQGSPKDVLKFNSITASYLSGKKKIEVPTFRRTGNGKSLILKGATGHNLKNVTASFPLSTLICVTGVSGSGKSSLVNETLYPILRTHFYRSRAKPLPYKSLEGIGHIDKVVEIDQSPIGRTPRSNPATYTGVFDPIRKLFSSIPESKIRGYKPGRFSFNVKGGRCETCRGGGMRVIEMNFLPNVLVECETCLGQRYNRETLEIIFKGKNINDVLSMSVDEAVVFFENIPAIYRKLVTLRDVGPGYITLGQQATTLSGGEAQRVKLSEELSKKDTGNTFYILDEPTTGLHFEDVAQLMKVLDKLVNKGNTVLVIEHNMEVIKMADYIIDIGLEGGKNGGKIISSGTPEEIVSRKKGHTAGYLKAELDL
jgi:excinuclease ABC subunit A